MTINSLTHRYDKKQLWYLATDCQRMRLTHGEIEVSAHRPFHERGISARVGNGMGDYFVHPIVTMAGTSLLGDTCWWGWLRDGFRTVDINSPNP